jgi:hypothetical protein
MIARRFAFVALSFACGILPATAQEPPAQRPFRSVFGGRTNPNSSQLLDLTLVLDGTYDDNVLAEETAGADPRLGQRGWYPSGTATIDYTRRGRRTTLNAGATTAIQYYQPLGSGIDRNHAADVALEVGLGRDAQLRVSQSAAYSTYYTLLGVPGSVVPGFAAPGLPTTAGPELQLGVSAESAIESHTDVGFTRSFGRGGRHSIEGRYGLATIDFATRGNTTHDVGSALRFGLTRNAAVRAGYAYQTATGGFGIDALRLHNVDAGIDYQRSLPGLRNTTLSVTTGSAVATGRGTRDFRLLADASLQHLMGRSWTLAGGYHRGFDYVGVLSELVSTDAVNVSLAGHASAAVELTFSGSYSVGQLGVRHGAEMLTYSGRARVQYALSRLFAVSSEYLYYVYDFEESAGLPSGLPRGLNRHGVRGGLVLLLPLVR